MKMQEPARLNLLNVLQKNLNYGEKKTYVHRTIYIGDYSFSSLQDCRLIQMVFESNIKLINDECEVPLTGFGLFYEGYFINIIEASDDCTIKHIRTVYESLRESLSNSPMLNRCKLLITSHHIIKRSFITWFGRPAKPPVLLEKIEVTNDPADTLRQIHTCIRKLYKLMDYLSSQPGDVIRATLDNISEVCQHYLPEANLLDFLLSSPALLDVSDFLSSYGTVPEVQFFEDLVWPIPTDFVPYNIVGKDRSKVLMYTPKDKEEEKKAEKPQERQSQELEEESKQDENEKKTTNK